MRRPRSCSSLHLNMPKEHIVEIPEIARLSLERAFHVFQSQSEMLEKSHIELQQKLNEAQVNLEAKNKELALRIAEIENIKEKQAGILESIDDSVFLVNSDKEINAANKTASEVFGQWAAHGINLIDFPELADALKVSEPVKNRDIEIILDGEKTCYMMTVVPMNQGKNGGIESKVVSLKDVSEHRNLQKRVNREDRMAALGKVAASVAHEIRNPLGAIEGFAMLLERDLKHEPNSQRLSGKIIYAARQLNSVVGNLLSYTREICPNKTVNDLRALVVDALDFVLPMADDHKVEIDKQFPEEPFLIEVDPVQISQVVTNLAVNAVEACPMRSGGKVEIKVFEEDGFAVLEVIDNGEGIPDNRKSQIFEPFFTMKDGGIGLGLSLCQRIIESHDGTIFECGELGGGARFIVKLKKSEG